MKGRGVEEGNVDGGKKLTHTGEADPKMGLKEESANKKKQKKTGKLRIKRGCIDMGKENKAMHVCVCYYSA